MTKVITIAPGIGEAGNTIAYVRARDPSIDKEPEDQYNQFVALSSRCMHLGCPVRYTPAAQRFICPCHGGVYDFRGFVAGGPPVRPLDRFYTRLNEQSGLVELGPRYSVNSQLRRFSPRDPAEPLDGIGQYLYPARWSTPAPPSG
jgi:Rieske Fe-S protein